MNAYSSRQFIASLLKSASIYAGQHEPFGQRQAPRNHAVFFLAASAAMPPAGQSALWKYKGIYIQTNQRFGQCSDVVNIPIAG